MLKWNAGKVSVGTSATQIVASRTGRKSLRLSGFGTGTGSVYLGPDNTVTTSSGVNPGANPGFNSPNGFDLLGAEGDVYGIAQSGSRDIYFVETYEE